MSGRGEPKSMKYTTVSPSSGLLRTAALSSCFFYFFDEVVDQAHFLCPDLYDGRSSLRTRRTNYLICQADKGPGLV